VSEPDSVKPVKAGRALAFTLLTENDFDVFRKTATSNGEHQAWSEVGSNEVTADDDDEIE
jgi:hypothetical protein